VCPGTSLTVNQNTQRTTRAVVPPGSKNIVRLKEDRLAAAHITGSSVPLRALRVGLGDSAPPAWRSTYNPELGAAICAHIAGGKSL